MSEWSSRTPKSDALFAPLAALAVAVAILPLASVGFAESSFLAAILALLGIGFMLPDLGKAAATPARPVWWGRVLGLLLLLWAVAQLVPVFPQWGIPLGLRWRGSADLWERVAANAPHPLSIALEPHGAVQLVLLWLGLAFAAAAASRRLFHAKPRRIFLHWVVFFATLEALWGFLSKDPVSGRVHGHFANSDAFGGLFVMTAPVTLGLILAATLKGWGRGELTFSRVSAGRTNLWNLILLWGALLVQWAAIFGSGSRGAAVAALVATGALLAGAAVGRPRLRKMLLWSLPVVAALAFAFNWNAMRYNVVDRIQDGDAVQAALPRLPIWQAAIRFCRDFPAGAGLGGMRSFLSHYQDGSVHGAVTLDFAHNDTLQFLGDLGLPGAALLAGLFVVLVVRAVRACKPRGDRHPERSESSPWVLRGVAAGVGGALLHAQAEFNLSARPPLQLLFLMLAGILVSAGRPHRKDTASPPILTRFSAVVLSLAALAIAGASSLMGASYLLSRSVATAAEVPPPDTDSPALAAIVRATANDKTATANLDLAERLDPFSPLAPAARAYWKLALQRNALTEAAAQFSPDEEPSPELVAQMALLLRSEESALLRDALAAADTAVARAPWSPRPLTLRAWILLRGATIGAFGDDIPDPSARALDDLRLAVGDDGLAPNDSILLESAAQAFLFTAQRTPADLEHLFAIGGKIIRLNPRLTDDVLELWWASGAPIERIFALEHLPTSCLWNLYRLAGQTAPELLPDILDRIEDSLSDPILYPPLLPDSPWIPAAAGSSAAILRHRARLAAERLRVAALNGDLAAIRDSAPVRAQTRYDVGRQRIDGTLSRGIAPQMRAANLRHLLDQRILPAPLQLETALQLVGDAPRDVTLIAILRDAAMLGTLSSEQRAALDALPVPPRLRADSEVPAAPVPDDSLDIPYRGETIVLDALEIPDDSLILRATFRFRATELPSTLDAVFTLRDPDGRLIASKPVRFDDASPDYRKGNPRFDVPCVIEVPLPATARLADTLQVVLRAPPRQTIYPDDLASAKKSLVFAVAPLRTAAAENPTEPEPPAIQEAPEPQAAPEPPPAVEPEPVPAAEPVDEPEPAAEPEPDPVPADAPASPPVAPASAADFSDDPDLRDFLVDDDPEPPAALDDELLDFLVDDDPAAPDAAHSTETPNASLP